MSDPILGRAYPALLAPGLVVWCGGEQRIVMRREGPDLALTMICDRDGLADPAWIGWELLQIDYSDPHTRDRVCRALAAHVGDTAAHAVRDRPDRLRAVADAVWGAAAPEVTP